MQPLQQQQLPMQGMQLLVSPCLPPGYLHAHPLHLLLETSSEDKEKQGLSSPGGASLASLSIMLFVTSSLISVDVKPKR